MPYKSPDVRRAYQRRWKMARRTQAVDALGGRCVDCGTNESLEFDHVDPYTKVHHDMWSWSQQRRDTELAKCVLRCTPCHIARTIRERQFANTRRYK